MTLKVNDLLLPTGEIDAASLFPDQTQAQVEDDLETWITLGLGLLTEAGADSIKMDYGAKAYTYWRAYSKKVDLLAAAPTSSSLSDAGVSESYSTERDKVWQRKAAFWESEWYKIKGSGIIATAIPPLPTTAVKTEFSW